MSATWSTLGKLSGTFAAENISRGVITVVPKAPAIAPRRRQYGNGFGGSVALKVLARYVYEPKQRNNLPECNRVVLTAVCREGELLSDLPITPE